MRNDNYWCEPSMSQRIQKLRGLCEDLELLQEMMDDFESVDADGDKVLYYLRTSTTTGVTLATKRNFIVNLIQEELDALKEEL